MTASAAILGMLPLALALGKGSETQAPLATAVIGGLFTSTVLTLFIVPVVYTIFDDIQRLVTGKSTDPVSILDEPGDGGDHAAGSAHSPAPSSSAGPVE